MRKIANLLFAIISIGLIFGSCSKSLSYSDYVKKERNLIQDFKSEKDLVFLQDYPSDGVFKSNEYYLDPSGVYINVVDSGNGKRAKANAQVYFRFSGASTLPLAESDTVTSPLPLSFYYGVTSTYTSTNSSSIGYYYLSPGIVVPLQYVGENAIVRLIIPFVNSIGSTSQNAYYATYYFDEVKYTQIIN